MREYITYIESDLINGIQNLASTEEEDYIIAGLETLLTSSGIFVSVSGIDVTTISGYVNDGTGYWDYTVTSGTDEEVVSWRLANYADTFRQAYRSQGFNVFEDTYTTISGRSDMEEYDKLFDASNATGIELTYSGTDGYLSVEYPSDRTTNLIRTNVDVADVRCYFGYSLNNTDWSYLAATIGDHAVISGALNLTAYDNATDAKAAYIILDSGTNRYSMPDGVQMRYGKMFFTIDSGSNTVAVSDYSWTDQIYFDDITAGTLNTGFVTITSPDGKTTFDGNSIKVRDESGQVRIELGLLS